MGHSWPLSTFFGSLWIVVNVFWIAVGHCLLTWNFLWLVGDRRGSFLVLISTVVNLLFITIAELIGNKIRKRFCEGLK